MYLAEIRIHNYRCFAAETIVCSPGVNVLIGENNAGKSTVIGALGLLFGQGSRRLQFFDFHQPPVDAMQPPAISRSVEQTARHFVSARTLQEGMLNRVEAAIRCFDPCLSCSTHAVGQMPLVIELRNLKNELLQGVQR